MKKITLVVVFCLFMPGFVIPDTGLTGEWIFTAEGSLYQMVFLFGDTSFVLFPADDFKDRFVPIPGQSDLESSMLEKILFIDNTFISLHYEDGHVLKGIYSLYRIYTAGDGYPADPERYKVWRLSVLDPDKEEYTFYLRHKTDFNAIQITYRDFPYFIFGALANAEGLPASLDSYGEKESYR